MIWINGVLMPTPDKGGIQITQHREWSKNTGRTASRKMVGDIISKKYEIVINWSRLTTAELSIIDTAINSADFFTVKFLKPGTETFITRYFYVADPTYPISYRKNSSTIYTGVSIDLVEQ